MLNEEIVVEFLAPNLKEAIKCIGYMWQEATLQHLTKKTTEIWDHWPLFKYIFLEDKGSEARLVGTGCGKNGGNWFEEESHAEVENFIAVSTFIFLLLLEGDLSDYVIGAVD